jgi:hypothetical protein
LRSKDGLAIRLVAHHHAALCKDGIGRPELRQQVGLVLSSCLGRVSTSSIARLSSGRHWRSRGKTAKAGLCFRLSLRFSISISSCQTSFFHHESLMTARASSQEDFHWGSAFRSGFVPLTMARDSTQTHPAAARVPWYRSIHNKPCGTARASSHYDFQQRPVLRLFSIHHKSLTTARASSQCDFQLRPVIRLRFSSSKVL